MESDKACADMTPSELNEIKAEVAKHPDETVCAPQILVPHTKCEKELYQAWVKARNENMELNKQLLETIEILRGERANTQDPALVDADLETIPPTQEDVARWRTPFYPPAQAVKANGNGEIHPVLKYIIDGCLGKKPIAPVGSYMGGLEYMEQEGDF